MRLRFLLVTTAVLGLLPELSAQYEPGTVFAVRLGTNASSVNVGGANVQNGVNIVPFQFSGGSWVSGSAMSASPTGASALTIGQTSTSEGALTISPDGRYLGLTGYRTGTSGTGTDRVVSRVDLNTGTFGGTAAAIDTSTVIPNAEAYTASSIRSAVWNSGGTQYWASGTSAGTGGTRTNTFGSTSGSTQVSNSVTNTRVVNIFNGQLYTSTASGAFVGINAVGTGTPTGSGNTTAVLAGTTTYGTGTASPYGFALSPNGLTLYVADDRTIANGGGIVKFTRPDALSAFTLATTFGTGTGSTFGARGLAVDFSDPANPVIYASTTEASNNRLITFQDLSGIQTGFVVIAAAGSNDVFRGVALAPVPEPATVLGIAVAGLGAVRLARRRQRGRGVTAAGDAAEPIGTEIA